MYSNECVQRKAFSQIAMGVYSSEYKNETKRKKKDLEGRHVIVRKHKSFIEIRV